MNERYSRFRPILGEIVASQRMLMPFVIFEQILQICYFTNTVSIYKTPRNLLAVQLPNC